MSDHVCEACFLPAPEHEPDLSVGLPPCCPGCSCGSGVFRCGWCGQPVDADGEPFPPEELSRLILDRVRMESLDRAEPIDGTCCGEEIEGERVRRVSREMALDAGDPDLEGWPI